MTTTIPGTIGGAISVGDSDELALLPLGGLPVGTTVWNEDVGAFFKLTTSDRTIIVAETTDGYDTPTWTFANATFTGFEGCTLVIVPQAPNVSYARAYVIDSVGSATEVDVLDPPDGATTGEFFGSVVLFDDALVSDSVVEANGTIGVRWVLVETAAGVTTDATLTGDGSSGDPLSVATAPAPTNAATFTAALNTATIALKGLVPPSNYAAMYTIAPPLGDASVTITPGLSRFSIYVLPDGVLTADRTLKLGSSGATSSDSFLLIDQDTSAHTLAVTNNADAPLISPQGSTLGGHKAFLFYFTTDWNYFLASWVK